MAENLPATSLTTERIRSAAKHLEQDSRRAQSVLNTNAIFFKIVAEEMEREHDSEAVAMLRQGLVEVLDSAHRLEYQCSALQNVSQRFEAGAELTDFGKHLDESTRQFLAVNPFDPMKDKLFQQFDRAIWNIHHAGEVAPGQEEEEIVMINNDGVRNNKCPLTGRPVIELENPVRRYDRFPSYQFSSKDIVLQERDVWIWGTECHHIYDQAAVMDYIIKAGRKQCRCAIAGCRTNLKKENFRCDASLSMEINELRIREQATQMAGYTELDFDDETC